MDSAERVNLRCSAVVFRGSQLLLLRRARDGVEDWVLPGGTPKPGESVGSCARREVAEEAGLFVTVERVAFVLEASNTANDSYILDIVFTARESDRRAIPHSAEPGLYPEFVELEDLGRLPLRPPMAGHLRALQAKGGRIGAAYLGNLWRPADLMGPAHADHVEEAAHDPV